MKALWILSFLFYSFGASANTPTEGNWQFEVFLDEKKIGYHDFSVSEDQGIKRVSMEAQFNVKLLFVNVFNYRHQNEEVWRDNCLTSIDAETEANGKDYLVRGQAARGEFWLQSAPAENQMPACVMTFAYWNPEFLKATQLLNSQTGDYEEVTISKVGEEPLSVKGRDVSAIKYSVIGAAAPITLWYAAADHRWLALESEVRGGRTLRYNPIRLPEPVVTSDAAGE